MGNKRIQKRSKLINKNDTSHTPSNVHLSHNTNPSSKTLTAEEIELEEAVFGHALINKGKQKEDASEDKSGEVEAPIQVDLHLAEVADDEVCYTVSNVLKHRHLALTDLTFFLLSSWDFSVVHDGYRRWKDGYDVYAETSFY